MLPPSEEDEKALSFCALRDTAMLPSVMRTSVPEVRMR
jgi:hypothetical protein